MEFRKMVMMTLDARQQKRHRCIEGLLDSEGEGGMIWENGIETCILSCKNWIASLCLTQDTACLGLVHGVDPERCYGEGSGGGGSCLGTHVRIKDFKIKKIKKTKKNSVSKYCKDRL